MSPFVKSHTSIDEQLKQVLYCTHILRSCETMMLCWRGTFLLYFAFMISYIITSSMHLTVTWSNIMLNRSNACVWNTVWCVFCSVFNVLWSEKCNFQMFVYKCLERTFINCSQNYSIRADVVCLSHILFIIWEGGISWRIWWFCYVQLNVVLFLIVVTVNRSNVGDVAAACNVVLQFLLARLHQQHEHCTITKVRLMIN